MNYSSEPLVLILMGTYNGEKYIREQLDSIAAQSHKNWRIVISDDGSTDRTLEIAEQWAEEVGYERVEFRTGPQKGFAQNFLSMACDPDLVADFYAFCDQDDVWHTDKISTALACLLKQNGLTTPWLYCGRTVYVSEARNYLRVSPLFSKRASLSNALVQSIAGGNTMVFNRCAVQLVRQNYQLAEVVSHDWLMYLLVTAVGGGVYYDREPKILYRQHGSNLIGSNTGLLSKLLRIRFLLKGSFRKWNDQNVEVLEPLKLNMPPAQRITFEKFCLARRESNAVKRMLLFASSGVYRQTLPGNFALAFGFLLKKI